MPADILARGMAADALRQIEDIAIGTSETKIVHRNTHYEFPVIGNVNFCISRIKKILVIDGKKLRLNTIH